MSLLNHSEQSWRKQTRNTIIREVDIAKRQRKIAGEEWPRKIKQTRKHLAPRKRAGKQRQSKANPTRSSPPSPPPPLLPLSREPDQIRAAVASDGSSPFPTAARGHRHHHRVGWGRKKRPGLASEGVGKNELEGESGGGGVPQLSGGNRRRLLRCSWRRMCFISKAFFFAVWFSKIDFRGSNFEMVRLMSYYVVGLFVAALKAEATVWHF